MLYVRYEMLDCLWGRKKKQTMLELRSHEMIDLQAAHHSLIYGEGWRGLASDRAIVHLYHRKITANLCYRRGKPPNLT